MNKKRFLAIILCAVFLFAILPTTAFAVETGVTTLSALKTALGLASPGDSVLVTGDITIPSGETVTVPTGVWVLLKGEPGNTVAPIKVESGGTLVNNGWIVSTWAGINHGPGARDVIRLETGATYSKGSTLVGTGGVINLKSGNLMLTQIEDGAHSPVDWIAYRLSVNGNAEIVSGKTLNVNADFQIISVSVLESLEVKGTLRLNGDVALGTFFVQEDATLDITGTLDMHKVDGWLYSGSVTMEKGATFILNGKKLSGKSNDALLTITEGQAVYGRNGNNNEVTFMLLGKATLNHWNIEFNGERPFDRFVVYGEFDWDEAAELMKFARPATLIVDKDLSIFGADVYGVIEVTSNGNLSTFGGPGDILKFYKPNPQSMGGGGRVEVNAGGGLNWRGGQLIGKSNDAEAVIQAVSGKVNYGATAWNQNLSWIYVHGEALANKNINADLVATVMVGGTLTVNKGVNIGSYQMGSEGKIIYLTDDGKTVTTPVNDPSTPTVSGDTTTAKITVPAVDTTGVTADNKLELKYEVNNIYDVIADATTNTVKLEIALPSNALTNDNVNISEITVPKYIFDLAKEENKTLVFDVTDISGKILYSWSFEGGKLKNGDSTMDMNLSLDIGGNLPKALTGANNPLLISFYHDGSLPVSSAGVKVYVGNQGYKAGDKVSFYYYNPTTSAYELIAENLIVDADGYVTVTITHCSDYVLTKVEAKKDDTTPGNTNPPNNDIPNTGDNPNHSNNENPNTGDNSNMMLWLILCGVSLTMLGFTVRRKKRHVMIK